MGYTKREWMRDMIDRLSVPGSDLRLIYCHVKQVAEQMEQDNLRVWDDEDGEDGSLPCEVDDPDEVEDDRDSLIRQGATQFADLVLGILNGSSKQTSSPLKGIRILDDALAEVNALLNRKERGSGVPLTFPFDKTSLRILGMEAYKADLRQSYQGMTEAYISMKAAASWPVVLEEDRKIYLEIGKSVAELVIRSLAVGGHTDGAWLARVCHGLRASEISGSFKDAD